MRRRDFLCTALLALAACAPTPRMPYRSRGALGPGVPAPALEPRILAVAAPLQCVPYARAVSGIAIRGDAWTWWHAAEGRYRRSNRPTVGSVLVFKRGRYLRYGHLAVVTAILNDREIVVRHANWLNEGQVHEDTPVVDVSRANDWSEVRVWYTPGNSYGKRRYPASGFIHPERLLAVL